MAINALDLIDEQLQKAAAPKSTGKPLFLFLKPDEKFLIRPLFDLKDSVVLMKHNLWSEDPAKRVNAICAKEEGKECLYCQQAQDNKKLTPKLHFYLPVYVYKGINQKTQKEISYERTLEDGSKQTEVVSGFRLLELAAFGTVGDILKWFREFTRDEDNCKITECDFALSQSGEGTSKSFVLMPKAPKPMHKDLVAQVATINAEGVKERVLEARAPFIADAPLARGNRDTDPAIEAVKVSSPATTEEAFDDTIADF